MNILIAKNDPILQALPERVMKKWKYNFDMVSNGVETVNVA